MNNKEAIILAGGLGTRLRGVLLGIPKCMAPVHGKPFLTYILDYLVNQKINKVILSVGYRKDHIINYFGKQYQSIEIDYAVENEPLGTGGAAKHAFNQCSQEDVFIINGDTYFTPDLQALESLHRHSYADITIAVKQLAETSRYGLIRADETGRITNFREKDRVTGSGWINGGIYLINKRIFKEFSSQKFSLENDVFKTSCSIFQIQAFQTDAFFLDIGIPEDYARAQNLLPSQL